MENLHSEALEGLKMMQQEGESVLLITLALNRCPHMSNCLWMTLRGVCVCVYQGRMKGWYIPALLTVTLSDRIQ